VQLVAHDRAPALHDDWQPPPVQSMLQYASSAQVVRHPPPVQPIVHELPGGHVVAQPPPVQLTSQVPLWGQTNVQPPCGQLSVQPSLPGGQLAPASVATGGGSFCAGAPPCGDPVGRGVAITHAVTTTANSAPSVLMANPNSPRYQAWV
jgi:hypothetical protein